jgi:hypothetical protein
VININTEIHRKIRDYATSHFKKLDTKDFVIGDAPFNRKCHLNAVQKVKEGKAVKVFSCYAFDRSDNTQCIHFINQLANGKYQDNTWGWLYQWCDYYLIKEISADEQEHIWDSLSDIRKSIVKLNSTWLERKIHKIEIENCI